MQLFFFFSISYYIKIIIVILQIDGTIVAPDEPKNWDPDLARLWLDFSKLHGVAFQGNGVIDGSGGKWWASSCKKNKSNVIPYDSLCKFFHAQVKSQTNRM